MTNGVERVKRPTRSCGVARLRVGILFMIVRGFAAFSHRVNEHKMLCGGKLAHMTHDDKRRDYEKNTAEKLTLQHGPRVHGVAREVNV